MGTKRQQKRFAAQSKLNTEAKMDLIGTIEVAMFGSTGNEIDLVDSLDILSNFSKEWEYDVIDEDENFIQIEIFGNRRNKDIIYDIEDGLIRRGFDAYID